MLVVPLPGLQSRSFGNRTGVARLQRPLRASEANGVAWLEARLPPEPARVEDQLCTFPPVSVEIRVRRARPQEAGFTRVVELKLTSAPGVIDPAEPAPE